MYPKDDIKIPNKKNDEDKKKEKIEDFGFSFGGDSDPESDFEENFSQELKREFNKYATEVANLDKSVKKNSRKDPMGFWQQRKWLYPKLAVTWIFKICIL